MNSASPRPAINVVEKNPYLPQPFVLTEVAVCLRDAIRAAGHPSEHLVNRVDPQAFSIVLGGSPALAQELQLDPRRCAIFNFEQLGSTSNLAGPDYWQWLRGWLVLDYHGSNIEFLKRHHGAGQQALELPIKPSESLSPATGEPKTVDVLFYGSLSERRQAVLAQLRDLGLTVELVAGAYGNELAPAVRRARLVLHIHYYESGLFPVARVLQPVMQGVPIVCERSVFSELNDWSDTGIFFAPYEELAATCALLLRMPGEAARRAAAARAFAQQIDFATPFVSVVQALQARERGEHLHEEGEERPLTHAEIEAILAAEGSTPPEADQPAPQLAVVRREPGQGAYGRWIAWLLVAFLVLGAINAYR
ncbi:hypothetical protein GCM10027034_44990 [Ramlibacter solisilvae]|uniref:glycosyltransferase family protein n=1 Tax=Ramlibacter tataouinensis TaxID=94132 RepID=UPI000777F9C6|nr:hypothetical protein [Ramlibacter tataouinensis]